MFPKLYVWMLLHRLTVMYREDLEVWEHRRERGGFSSPLGEPTLPTLCGELGGDFTELLERYSENAPAAIRFHLSR